MKKVAILGRPNVGKSSLFNRLLKRREAITSDQSGTTRDIRRNLVTISQDREFELLDTGGIDEGNELFDKVAQMSMRAAKEADIILYMVDGKMLPDDEDKRIFYELQKSAKKIALVVNKIDNESHEEEIGWEFSSFGAKNLFFISVSHNKNIRKLINWLDSNLKDEPTLELEEDDELSFEEFLSIEETLADRRSFSERNFHGSFAPVKRRTLDEKLVEEESNNQIKIGIIGRVNVGKSSLLNALLGEDRSVVSSIAGTTIDPIDEAIVRDDKIYTFVDTAGIRKRGKIEGIEKFALNRTQKQLENADIALLVLDASEEFKELDERIASLAEKFELGVIIVLNKWDKALYSYEESVKKVRDRFKFLSFAPIITVSALTKKRVHKLYEVIDRVYANYTRRIPTSKLNELIKYANQRHHLPSDMGKVVKIYFATQFDIKPPRFALIMNRPKALHFSYKRYLMNQLRKYYDFEGSPLILEPKKKKADEDFE
jgi:GTP-binding protein